MSLLTGYRALLLIAGGLYALALVLATRVRLLGDGELEVGGLAPLDERSVVLERAR